MWSVRQRRERDKRSAHNQFKQFHVKMPGEEIKDMDLTVFKGEILGMTSLSGHGKLALGYGFMGLYPVEGEVFMKIKSLRRWKQKQILSKVSMYCRMTGKAWAYSRNILLKIISFLPVIDKNMFPEVLV